MKDQAAAPVEVRLYGHLRARFGRGHRLSVRTPGEAVRALCVVVPGFKAHVLKHSEPGYRVVVDRNVLTAGRRGPPRGTPIAADEELHHPSGRAAIKIVPVVAGAAGGGKILLGAALIAASFIPGLNVAVWQGVVATTWSSIAFNVGVSMVLGGVSQMLAGSPKGITPSERPNNQPSYNFNGPINVTGQGQPVPICYGRMRVGSVVISSGLSTAQLA